ALAAVYPRTPEDASAFTQTLMELGATVCGPAGAPHCDACPLAEECLAHREKRETDFPVRTPKRPRTIVDKTVLILRRKNAYAIRRRPENGLLAGLWEFPSEDRVMTDPEVRQWLGARGFRVACMEPTVYAKHIFTHIEWHMNGFYCVLEEDGCASDGGFVWAEKQELAAVYALPSAFRAFLKRIETD
ncbi:MAG: NUDIX domain-containing protein, partial [Eubacteriales bacterium]